MRRTDAPQTDVAFVAKAKRPLQARSKATRAALIDAARQLWEAKSVDGVSIEQICEAANVSVGTFYVYFKRKEHLLILVTYMGYLRGEAELTELLAGDEPTLAICHRMTDLLAGRLRRMDKRLLSRGIEESFRFFREMEAAYPDDLQSMRAWAGVLIARGRARGEVRDDWDPEMATMMIHWSVLQAILRWAWGVMPDADLEIDMRRRVELILNGLTTPRVS